MKKHRLKRCYARCLTQAVINNQDPRITKLFNENDDVIDHLYRVPCQHHKIAFSALKSHFRHYHHVSDAFAQDLFDCFEEIRNKNDTTSTKLAQSARLWKMKIWKLFLLTSV
ncbi:unnamed protein product [Rotaria sp. Silwood2]|nr:unnamed protein product [Rotaria sp. Silwood2]CAF4198034.1 unnamed protein product [Rotaria sp. Silwood2]